MTPRSQSQPKANGDHGDRHGRKFMLVGIAAFLATAITMSAGLMLTNKAKAHLRKERQGYEHTQTKPTRAEIEAMVDKLAAYESNSVGPYDLKIHIHMANWGAVVSLLEAARYQAMSVGPSAFIDSGRFGYVEGYGGIAASLTSGPKAEAEEKALALHTKPIARPGGQTWSYSVPVPTEGWQRVCWPDGRCEDGWGNTLPKERP